MTEPGPRRRWGRVVASSGLGVAAIVVAGVAWNLSSLRGLPDIGDPFDVAAFSTPVRDEDNAFVLYRQAAAKFRLWDGQATFLWSTASEPERRWLAENREALDLWRLGAERPDALFVAPGVVVFDTNYDVVQNLRSLARLACLEGSRLEADGDLRGAWDWYRAALRCSRHCGRRGTLIERLVATSIHFIAIGRITTWASLPGNDAGAIRRALDEVQAIDAMTPPFSDCVKAEYLGFVHTMGYSAMLWKFLDSVTPSWGAPKLAALRAEAFLKREPERTRRLLGLVVANWLAYCDRPLVDRPPLDPRHELVYLADASATPDARLLGPELMNSWFDSTILLKWLLPAMNAGRSAVDRERARQAGLVIHLASELYQREHGRPPASPEALVGPYLQELPSEAPPK